MNEVRVSEYQVHSVKFGEQLSSFLRRRWFVVFAVIFGLFVGLPFIAPLFMEIGWSSLGKAIYLIYSFLCHQLPQRSFFLFGPQTSYSLAELQAAGVNTHEMLLLRQFIGSPEIGWKVAWSDRMVSMYTSMLLFGLAWRLLKSRIPKLPWWGLIVLLLPMAIDGSSHFVSDLAGMGQGFRDSNAWLATVTQQAFAPSFYSGDALGSFNSWMRLITGIFFGVGIVWFAFPYVDEAFQTPVRQRQAWAEQDRAFMERVLNDARNTRS